MSTGGDLLDQLKTMLPEIMASTESKLRSQLAERNFNLIEERREALRKEYLGKIQRQAESIRESVQAQSQQLQDRIFEAKTILNRPLPMSLTEAEQTELVEETVSHILQDQSLMEDLVGSRLPLIKASLECQMEIQTDQAIQDAKRQTLNTLEQVRNQWEKNRKAYWTATARQQLEAMAEEYKELEQRRDFIHEALKAKRLQREQQKVKEAQIYQENERIAQIKAQIDKITKKKTTKA